MSNLIYFPHFDSLNLYEALLKHLFVYLQFVEFGELTGNKTDDILKQVQSVSLIIQTGIPMV